MGRAEAWEALVTRSQRTRARDAAAAIEARRRGLSLRQIADLVGRSPGWVHLVLSATNCRKDRPIQRIASVDGAQN
jgi:hypothetical protein